ncbi:MAG: M48 family metallopeptidase, partial [Nevskiales bacterium]
MKKTMIFLGLLALTTVAGAQTQVKPGFNLFSVQQDIEIGKQSADQAERQLPILDDSSVEDYVDDLVERLGAAAPGHKFPYQGKVVNATDINAFALPGGYIGINAGLLLTTQNESELAGVLSHEIAHVTQRHIARQIEATQTLNMATMAALLVALIASGGSGDLAQAALTLGISGIQQRQINFTRSHELEADRVGIRTLASAGFDPNGMASFFQRMEEQTRLYGDAVPEILRTHPVNVTRITEARTRAAGYPPVKPADGREYPLMQARLRVLSSVQATDALVHFQSRTQNNAGTEADRYGLGLALLRTGQPEVARELFATLVQ